MNDIFIENLKKLSIKELFMVYELSINEKRILILLEVERRINANNNTIGETRSGSKEHGGTLSEEKTCCKE